MGTFGGVELDDVELTGQRVLLRRWRPEDAAAVREIMRDESMFRFLPLPRPYTADMAEEFVRVSGHEGRAEGRGVGSAVVERGSGRLVGAAAVRFGRSASIGYWIDPAAQGRGYATEATCLLRDLALDLGLPRVELECDTRNLAAAKVALRAGLRFEGIARGPLPSGGAEDPHTHCDLARFGLPAGEPHAPIRPAFPAVPGGMLTDGEIGLRPVVPDDAHALWEVEDDVAAGWGFSDGRPHPDQLRRVANDAGLMWLVGPHAKFAIVELAGGAVAGEITVRASGPPQVGGIGYGVHPAFRGRGYTTRALRLIAPWAFEQAAFARLELGAKSGNVASQRAAANAGFQPEGTLPARLRNPDGTFSDEITFALVNPRHR